MSLMDLHKYLTFKSSQKALNIETTITLLPNDLNIHFISTLWTPISNDEHLWKQQDGSMLNANASYE